MPRHIHKTSFAYASIGMARKLTHGEAVSIALSYGFEPLDTFPGKGRTTWICRHKECGRQVEVKLANIKAGKNSCKYCNGQFVDPVHAVERARAVGLEPLEPYVDSKHKWRCRCLKCGSEVCPQYNTIITKIQHNHHQKIGVSFLWSVGGW